MHIASRIYNWCSKMAHNAAKRNAPPGAAEVAVQKSVRFEVYGEELIAKTVKSSGGTGRVYLPPDWIGKTVKIIRID